MQRAGSLVGAARGAIDRLLRGIGGFTSRVYRKAGDDDIFFLAGGIAFNIVLAAIPFFLLLLAIFGFALQFVDDPDQVLIEYIFNVLPDNDDLRSAVLRFIDRLLAARFNTGIVGLLLFVWVSTRLFGSLRSALRSVFDIQQERGIIAGKIFDMKMVVIAGTLFAANTSITLLLTVVQTGAIELIGLSENGVVDQLSLLYAQLLAYVSIFLMFFLIYRYLPARRIPSRIAAVAAAFSSVAFELLKSAFALYVTYAANYESTYGVVASAVVVVFWVYYAAAVFVLGAEVGQVYELYRIRGKQRELLD